MQGKNIATWTLLAVGIMAVALIWMMTKMARTARADMNLLLLAGGLVAGAVVGLVALALSRHGNHRADHR